MKSRRFIDLGISVKIIRMTKNLFITDIPLFNLASVEAQPLSTNVLI